MQNRNMGPVSSGEALAGESVAVGLVDGLVEEVTRLLFETYAVTLVRDASPVAQTLRSIGLLSMIGFSSHSLSGSLLMALPRDVVRRTLPAPDASLADWSGELANQLLGRLKNQLLKYQVVINLSLPVVVSGEALQLPASTRQITRYYSFDSGFGKLFIRLDMEMSPTLQFVRQSDTEHEASIDEGELLLF
jgi:CheY-specific phosphatase CheX